MINVQVQNLPQPAPVQPILPALFRYQYFDSKLVVLFVTTTSGIIVEARDAESHRVGKFDTGLEKCTNTDAWALENAMSVTFSNKA